VKRALATLLAGLFAVASLSGQTKKQRGTDPTKPTALPITLNQPPGLYAVFETTMGRIVCRLFADKAPEAVRNFVGLTNGTKRWYDDNKKTWVRHRYYDGLTFHRVIPNFMIQGGDQTGTGMGNIGYTFKDELSPDLKFDQPGRLAMANAGPNTNGAQFFITVAPTEWLNQHHTIFGEVVEGQSVANAISEVSRDSSDKPTTTVMIYNVAIVNIKTTSAVSPARVAPRPTKPN
jgi:peptidyl-prolyl cis-trans isomerase A (cyclophilin A)